MSFWTKFWIVTRRASALVALLMLISWAVWTAAWEPEIMDFGLTFASLGWLALALTVAAILVWAMILCYKKVFDWGGWSIAVNSIILLVGIPLVLFGAPVLVASIDLSKVLLPTLLMLTIPVLAWLNLDPYPILNREKRKVMKLRLSNSTSGSKTTSAATTTYRKVPATDPTTTPDPDSSAAPAAGPSA